MEQGNRPSEEELNQIQSEANEFESRRISDEFTSKELEESLVDPQMPPAEFAEALRVARESIVFHYLMNRPFACSHVFPSYERYKECKKMLAEDVPLDFDSKKATPVYGIENAFSLHIAIPGWRQRKSLSTFFKSDFGMVNPSRYDEGLSGMILEPEFFEKLVPTDEETSKTGNSYIKKATKIKKGFGGSGQEASWPHGIDPDMGIRALTIEDGKEVTVPIKPEDVDYFFELKYSKSILKTKHPKDMSWQWHVVFYRANGERLSDNEVKEIYEQALKEDQLDQQQGYHSQFDITSEIDIRNQLAFRKEDDKKGTINNGNNPRSTN